MKVKLTPLRLKKLIEELIPSSDDNSDDIIKSYEDDGYYKWFDYIDPEYRDKINPYHLESVLKKSLSIYRNRFGYDLKRVVIKDKGKVVAFLIYSNTTGTKEGLGDDATYTVLLSTAVHPDYRQRGLLRRMIDAANIQKPYLVHTSSISTPHVWEKLGCKIVKEVPGSGQVQKCD